MEPVPVDEVPRQEGFTYQVKWDGLRMLAFVGSDVALQNRKGRLKTKTFPEFQNLADIEGKPLVLDGEVVAIRNGKPDFPAVLKRNFHSEPPPGHQPAQYVVFDVLCHRGQDIRGQPLSYRLRLLHQIEFPPGVATIDDFPDGVGLFEKVRALGWEGVVAKKLCSPYVAGKSNYWQKIKITHKEVFTIIGYTLNQGRLASLRLAREDDMLAPVGSVGSGLSVELGRWLLPVLRSIEHNGELAPLLKAEVEFSQWTDDLRLRAPVLKKIFAGDKAIDLS